MTQETLLIVVAASVVAMIIGFIIGKSVANGDTNQNQAVQQAKEELESYKAAVSEHFGKTADLVDNLTASYKEVFEHLGSSAKGLLSEEEVNKHIASRAEKAITLTYIAEVASESELDGAANDKEERKTEAVVDSAKADAEKMAESLADSGSESDKSVDKENKT